MISRLSICRAVLLAVAVALTAMPAAAQQALKAKPLVAAKPEQQPAALPGTVGAAVKPDRGAVQTNLAPNEALFDAVNRGDLPAVKEAMNRGASLDSRNSLGLTPIELSVDLGRNPVTFFLLSVRSGTEGGGSAPAEAAPAKRVATAQGAPVAAPRPAPRPVAPAQAQVAQTRAPALSQDPGTPAPQSGFLGFGSSR